MGLLHIVSELKRRIFRGSGSKTIVHTFILCHVVCLTVSEVNWLLVLVSKDLL